jgi:hypothetical protein
VDALAHAARAQQQSSDFRGFLAMKVALMATRARAATRRPETSRCHTDLHCACFSDRTK